ncbi:MAG TPA: penicillin-binding protein 2 [Steroidobacteraceae bacterium]|nr:penicillin-binding protein 2 [Steroidobacteraceae bacterium]
MSPVRIKDHWREQRIFDRRAIFAGALMALLALALFGRLYLLQVTRHEYYSALSQENRVRTDPIPAARGLIMDRFGEVIASNQPTFQLELIPDEVPDLSGSLQRLAKLGLLQADDIPELISTIKSRRSFDNVPIVLHLSDDQVARFAVHRYEFPGIDITPQEARWYPEGPLAVDAMGYVGTISEQDLAHIDRAAYAGTAVIGKTGVEAAFEKQLHGTNGFRQILVDAQGRPVQKPGVFAKDLEVKAPTPGDDVILSLDLKVQKVAEAALAGQEGAVVAIDPNNGDIIALVSSPSFDPNLFARGINVQQYHALTDDPQRPLFNRALRAQLPSGSTIKPGLALGALTDGVVDPNQEVLSPYSYHLPGSRHLYHNANHENCGRVDLSAAIIVSCDVYFYRLAHEMGIDRIAAWLPNFGFGRPTGIDIGGEQSGLSPSPAWKATHFRNPADRVWFPGDTVILGIGQGYFLVTPLQLAHYASILATRGFSFEPRLVTGLRDPRTGKIHWKRPILDGDLTMISPASWKLVVNAMVGVTSSEKPLGTAYWQMRGSPYTIAGKTGTAQLVRESATGAASERDYSKDKTLERLRDDAWFIAFAPADKPRIAVAVLVEHAGWGDVAAAPVARKVLDAYLLGPGGKLLPAAPRGPYSEPTDLKPRVERSMPALPTPAPAVQQIADQPRASGAPPTQ